MRVQAITQLLLPNQKKTINRDENVINLCCAISDRLDDVMDSLENALVQFQADPKSCRLLAQQPFINSRITSVSGAGL